MYLYSVGMSVSASVNMELGDVSSDGNMSTEHEPDGPGSGNELSDRGNEHDEDSISDSESCESESEGDDRHSDGDVRGCTRKRRRTLPGRKMQVVGGKWKRKEPTSLLWTSSDITPGPTFSTRSRVCSAVSFFSLILTRTVWELLVQETNRYANQAQLPEGARVWYPVTVEEMKAYVGITILMGVVCLPRIEQYWQTSHELLRQPLANIVTYQISADLEVPTLV